ncbi:hypothetical protein SAMN04488063_2841 [Halopelagius inordinatus]|uniref:CARDB protein n=1 Tax=Halopelagius inordinatus TaxID=553467 RepID=A0A1I2U9X1_9EURY|nr:hypothetical protein [Halopelagius inordinatus]SFG73934.1 hypothetical protein SAMN04488063_2841 [Halopelagius inordinatus]
MMANVSRLIDIGDNLKRAREETDGDIDEELDAVQAQLPEFSDRTRADEEDTLDTIDDHLETLETRTDGAATEEIRAARSRIRAVGNSQTGAADSVSVIDAETRYADAGTDRIEGETGGDEVEFWVVLENEGEERRVTVEIPFYRDEQEVARVRGESVRLGSSEQETVTLITEVPDGAEYYAVDIGTTEAGDGPSSGEER